MPSAYDEMPYNFQCVNPQCAKSFQMSLRSLLPAHVKEVACPHCGTAIDIRESKRTGPIGKAFDTANQVDLQKQNDGRAKP
jgi:hypothetical protein